MKNRKDILLVCVIFTITTMLVYAQKNDTSSSLQSINHKAAKDSLLNKEFQKLGLTEEKLSKLKGIGIDVREDLYHGKAANEKLDAAMHDLIIIGKVLSIVDMPNLKSVPFHSKVNIQILEVLKGLKPQTDTIQLLREDGPITDSSPAVRVEVVPSAKFVLGETAVYFLSNIYNDSFLTSRYKSYFSNKSAELPRQAYWVRPQSKHQIINSNVKYHERDIPLIEFVSEIKKVAQILDKPSIK
ncbi:MAG: hypothetical protein PHP42_07820 [Bacteroidota bacterium]|nr:hypothetical protein [Bacteroidota bacterium]